jgi:DNA-binding MarR family transcriptional regulator
VRRQGNKEDGRLVEVHLTARGRRLVAALAAQHQAQLGALAAVTEAARISANREPAPGLPSSSRR